MQPKCLNITKKALVTWRTEKGHSYWKQIIQEKYKIQNFA